MNDLSSGSFLFCLFLSALFSFFLLSMIFLVPFFPLFPLEISNYGHLHFNSHFFSLLDRFSHIQLLIDETLRRSLSLLFFSHFSLIACHPFNININITFPPFPFPLIVLSLHRLETSSKGFSTSRSLSLSQLLIVRDSSPHRRRCNDI